MNRTRVKICGITRPEDAISAVEAGADAIGMVFWSGSKRAIDTKRARQIAELIPPTVCVVGVFVEASTDTVRETAVETGITVAQLSGLIGPGDWTTLPRMLRIVRGLGISRSEVPNAPVQMKGVNDYLLDNCTAGRPGGTGEAFDWALAEGFRSWGRIWLAGGLNPMNVGEAIAVVRPHAVDVSSGVESSPGIKSPELIRAFISAVHHADHAIAKAKQNAN